jgi:hypothetical protein
MTVDKKESAHAWQPRPLMTNEETSSLMGNKHEQVLGAPSAMNVGALWDSNATARRATPPPGLPATDSL